MRANHYQLGQTGWNDLFVSGLVLRPGPAAPTWNNTYFGYSYAVGDSAYGVWHIDHRYKPASTVNMHVHVRPLTTDTGNIVFKFNWRYARGYSQDVYSVVTPTLVVAQPGAGTIEKHQILETADMTIPNLETDGCILFSVERDATDAFTGGVILDFVDLHFQMDRVATTGRNKGTGWDP